MSAGDLVVATLAGISDDYLEDACRRMSNGRAPLGLGALIARYADEFCVRSDVALAIAMHETGRFEYGGDDPQFSADPSFHNYGGIKTTDGTATQHFVTEAMGVVGLVGHLAWYAHPWHTHPMCSQTYDPRHFSWAGIGGHKGNLRIVSDFGAPNNIWNNSTSYAQAIISLVEEVGS